MRCKYCGSKAIYPYTNHEHSSTKKVVVNTLIWGAIGTAASLAGKNVQGYRCSTCGSFSEQTMSYLEESAINSAISEAREKGTSLSYERYAEKYHGIEQIMLYARPAAQTLDNALPEGKIEEDLVSDQELQIIQQKQNIKYFYTPGKYTKNSPVLIERVTIETAGGTDVLRMSVRNIGDKILRSTYFKACVYDDVGDPISECSCVYQGLSVGPGEYLPVDKTFDLKTDVAYKVDIVCEKAAFTDDSAWRQSETPVEYALPERTELTPQSFSQHKYLLELFTQKCKPDFEGKLYIPAFAEGYRLCVCGSVANAGESCRLCGLSEDSLHEIMDYDNLVECRCAMIQATAAKRTEKVRAIYQKAQELKYNEALQRWKNATQSNDFEEAAEMFSKLCGYKDATKLVDACHEQAKKLRPQEIYCSAKLLMASTPQTEENYQKAIKKFQSVLNYSDAQSQIAICQQKIEEVKALKAKEEADRLERERQAERERQHAERIAKRKKIITAIVSSIISIAAIFAIIYATVIAPTNAKNEAYDKAISLMNDGNIIEAYDALIALDGYKDSAEKASSIYLQYKVEKIKIANIGDYVKFGTYEQDNNLSNGTEEIEWLILDKQDNKVLVISKYILDYKQYNDWVKGNNWEKSDLRQWLNSDFISSAFTPDERAIIPTVTVSADKNPEYDTDPGNPTQDQVFCLSINEAYKYFNTDEARICEFTASVAEDHAFFADITCWWLRSPGKDQFNRAEIDYNGSVRTTEYKERSGVRPAMWIDLNS